MVIENAECAYARLADLLLANAGNHPSLSRLVRPPTILDNGPARHYKSRSGTQADSYFAADEYTPSGRLDDRAWLNKQTFIGLWQPKRLING